MSQQVKGWKEGEMVPKDGTGVSYTCISILQVECGEKFYF